VQLHQLRALAHRAQHAALLRLWRACKEVARQAAWARNPGAPAAGEHGAPPARRPPARHTGSPAASGARRKAAAAAHLARRTRPPWRRCTAAPPAASAPAPGPGPPRTRAAAAAAAPAAPAACPRPQSPLATRTALREGRGVGGWGGQLRGLAWRRWAGAGRPGRSAACAQGAHPTPGRAASTARTRAV
jgi:hypothetical protein